MNHVIEFQNVRKQFGAKVVLDEITFRVKAGEIVFILGVSGTGKSVLLKNIVGLLKPDAGEIRVDGTVVSCLDEEGLFPIRRKCGMVFQHPALFDSLTVFENVAFGLRKHFTLEETEVKKRVFEALDTVHLRGIESQFPSQISYGMQKRVSLARTIAIKPQILLFDEPTTGLDPVTTNAINQLIHELSRKLKTTSLVVSHDMHCALDIADRVIVLDKGKVIEDATPEALKKSQNKLVQDFLAEVNE